MLMEVKKELKLLFLSTKYNIMKEMTNALSFILNILFMMLNNASFLVQWIIFFSIKSDFGGYTMKEIMLIWGISSASYGVSRIIFGGVFKLPEYIEEGKLDAYLVLPKDALLSVASSRTVISAMGDLLYGLIVSLVFYHKLHEILLILLFIILGAIIETSLAVILNSLAFKYLKIGDFSNSILGAFITFSIYPESIFSDGLKILLYTVIPVGFAVYLPVKSIINFNLGYIFIVLLFTMIISVIAYKIFNRGLKKYSSSNLMSAR